jgi:AcrR family transcriptional regulator
VSQPSASTPRGRHAPPLEVRQDRQRRRLFAAAATVFARMGYADASAEAIAREAGMSKATFYEHFDNKEDCIVALFDAAIGVVGEAMRRAGEAALAESVPADARLVRTRVHATVHAFLQALVDFPDEAQTLLVEIVGAGPRALERRDAALDRIAAMIDGFNREDAARGVAARFESPHDAFAIVGAVVELASRQIRTGRPASMAELEPVVERLVLGLVGAAG